MMYQGHIFFSGTVQGIGFRYAALRYARDLKLKGWVKNLSDGRVEILAEGNKSTIEKLCQDIERHFGGFIRSKDINLEESQGRFKDFQIVY